MVHSDASLGSYVTLGHRVVCLARHVDEHVLLGNGCVVNNGAVIGGGRVRAAGAVVLESKPVPQG